MTMALLAAAACGSATTETAPEAPTPAPVADYPLPTGFDDVVLRLFVGANQPDPLPILAAFPELTLYGDGRMLVWDRDGSQSILPAWLEVRVSPAGMQRLVAEADARGALDPLERYGSTNLADGDSTRFEVDTGDRQAQVSVYDLGGEQFAEDLLTPEQLDARRQLVELRDALRDFRGLLGDDILSEQPYALETVAVIGIERGLRSSTDFPFDLRVTGELLESRVEPVQCQVVTGSDLDELVALLEQADGATVWRIGSRAWDLAFRPLLPDEAGCAALADQ